MPDHKINPLAKILIHLVTTARKSAQPTRATLASGLDLAVRTDHEQISVVGWRADGPTGVSEAEVVRDHLVAALQFISAPDAPTPAITLDAGDMRIAGVIRRAWRIRVTLGVQLPLL